MRDTWQYLIRSYPQRRLYWATFAAGLLVCAWVWIRATGSSADDEFAHLIIARDAWRVPYFVLDLWGRPVNTLIYMPGALLGLNGVRLSAFLMMILTALLTTHIARRLGLMRLYLIPLLFLFQPGVIDQSYAAVTGVPFMLLLTLGIALWLEDHEIAASMVFACLSLTRHEGIALFGIWWVYLLFQGKRRAAFWGWLPIVVYNLAFLIVVNPPLSELPFMTYFTPNRGDGYGSGGWLHFVGGLLIMAGLPICVLCLYSIPRLRRLNGYLLIFIPHAIYFVMHTIFFRFALFATGGYYEFLLPILPAVAILAALGAEGIIEGLLRAAKRHTERTRQGLKVVWGMIVFLPVIALSLMTTPRMIHSGQTAVINAAHWLKTQDVDPSDVYSMNVWFHYYYDLPLREFDGWIHLPAPASMQTGDIFIWEGYAEEKSAYTHEYFSDPRNGWQEIADFEGAKVFVKR